MYENRVLNKMARTGTPLLLNFISKVWKRGIEWKRQNYLLIINESE
jgi:hypothetical protein